jgi:2-aminobenzoate-CoA ligase
MSNYTAHLDTFTRDNLPAPELQADLVFSLKALQFPDKLNCAAELLDTHIQQGRGNSIALRSPHSKWSYQILYEKANQIAHVLTEDLGLVPGNRVLLRSANNPMLAACWLGVVKAGGVVVATMPLLRAKDLEPVINKAELKLALCDKRLESELVNATTLAPGLQRICLFSGAEDEPSELERLMATKPSNFENVKTAVDDVVLIAFTSGTTGQPKGTMHYHRDVMAMCVCVGSNLIKADANDIFIGSPPLAFTFGLGMQLAFPLYAGACTLLLERAGPVDLAEAISKYKATVCSTAPTAYRAILNNLGDHDISSLKKPVSAGEHLPPPIFKQWKETTGNSIIDGLGTTEMIHIFVSAAGDETRAGATGKALNGYECCILDAEDNPLPPGDAGRLAVKGPTACKYLADDRQKDYVVNGWNITGDTCYMDEDGYVFYKGRSDDMIISAGYNISGPEVEAALLGHEAVNECAVVSAEDIERGTIVKAFIVLNEGHQASEELITTLQAYAKQSIAPYKYPRAIEFIGALPKTQTGKTQRHKLRE